MVLYKYTYQKGYNAFGTSCFKLILLRYPVIKETMHGYWILYYSDKKFVYKNSKNGFARNTKKRALQDFIIKKKKQIEILKSNIKNLETLLNEIKIETPKLCKTCLWWNIDYGCNKQVIKLNTFCYGYEKNKKDI